MDDTETLRLLTASALIAFAVLAWIVVWSVAKRYKPDKNEIDDDPWPS